MKTIIFVLQKDFGSYKKGEKFDCFGGLVSGITTEDDETINFSDKEWFKIQTKVKK